MRIAFWGTGNTSKKHINTIKRLSNQFEIIAFTDGAYREDGNKRSWEGYKLVEPQILPCLELDYLCILSIWEWEIRKRIYDEKLFDLSRIISLHEICMMDSFGIDIDGGYETVMRIIHPMQRESAELWRVYEYLKKKYAYVLCDNNYWRIDTEKKVHFNKNVRPIWILWLQGIEQAPELVKVCVHSIQRKLGKEEYICLLDKANIFDYIDLPDYIVDNWEKGIISNTHFSDLVRVRLLNVYGGVWIDATIYFTGEKLPNYVKNNRLFMFNIWEYWRNRKTPLISASWLISSEPQNKMLMILESFFNEYWKTEKTMVNYYLFHLFWSMVVEFFPNEWDAVETVLRDPAQLLSEEINNKFDDVRFKNLKQGSDIHKLSYKKTLVENDGNNFWSKICKTEEVNQI